MRRWPVATVSGLGALAALGAAATAAAALTPNRTAWWNEAPLGLVVSPSPVQPDQLMVAEGTAAPQAVAAVYYAVAGSQAAGGAPAAVSATLRMPLDTGSSVGTPAVEACPIQPAAAAWHKGGGQTGTPPADDCSNGKAVAGQLSSDGTSLLFALTPAQQQAGSPGVFDLELVPAAPTPFQTVFNRPTDGDFTVTPPPAAGGTSAPGTGGAPAPGGSSAPAGGDQGSAAPSGSDTSGGGSGSVASSPDLGSGDLGSAPALSAPSLPSSSSAPTGSGSASTGTSGGVSRVAAGALRPTASSASGGSGGGWLGGRRKQVFGVWLLVDVGLVLFLYGSELERAPRLLGSVAARRGAARVQPEPEAAPAAVEVRGIGRFARPRAEPARRLY